MSNERDTRRDIIDLRLADAGWNVADATQVRLELDIVKAHARRMEEVFDKLYPQYAGELAKVLVSDDPRVYGKGGLLDQFTNNDMPRIAISVDMLDTGIDVREIVNLVFAKPVYSYTKFWQMIGRGTRLLESNKPKPWCLEKDVFLILDCWDNFEYFKLNPKGKTPTSQLPLPVRVATFKARKPKTDTDRNLKHFFVPRKDIEAEDYDLSFSRYKVDVFDEIKYEAPSVILDKLIKAEVGETSDEDLAKIQSGIVKELLELRDMIG